jgi:COMPASS component SWD3
MTSTKDTILWDANTGTSIKTLGGNRSYLSNVAWSHDGNNLASTSMDETIALWDANTGKLIRTVGINMPSAWDVAWSTDSKTLDKVRIRTEPSNSGMSILII